MRKNPKIKLCAGFRQRCDMFLRGSENFIMQYGSEQISGISGLPPSLFEIIKNSNFNVQLLSIKHTSKSLTNIVKLSIELFLSKSIFSPFDLDRGPAVWH